MARSPYPIDPWVPEFLELKRQVLLGCGEDPARIASNAELDPDYRRICIELSVTATVLRMAEEEAIDGVIAPTNERFVTEWRDFEVRFDAPLGEVFLSDMGLPSGQADESKITHRSMHPSASDLNDVVSYIRDRAEAEAVDENLYWVLTDGLSAWDKLVHRAGLEIDGVFRRLDLAPTALVPQEVSKKYGTERLSLYAKWADARRSFIFGAFHSSVAMSRAVLETLLEDVYRLPGNLHKKITSYQQQYGRDQVLDRIRVAAKFILHARIDVPASEFDAKREAKVANEVLADLEREVAAALYCLRNLIERAPSALSPRQLTIEERREEV